MKWALAAAARGAPTQPEGLLIVARKEPEDRAFKGIPPGLLVLRHGMIPGTWDLPVYILLVWHFDHFSI